MDAHVLSRNGPPTPQTFRCLLDVSAPILLAAEHFDWGQVSAHLCESDRAICHDGAVTVISHPDVSNALEVEP